ncbi:MAG: SDR family oxidoreductase [Prosthecochloris sp.]|nr:SDR family oxidoreductase [Prosthecochloris sp.]
MDRVLITGATSGIGEAFSREYAARGADLVLVARSAEQLETLAGELMEKNGITVTTFPQDLSIPQSAERLVSSCHNAGLAIGTLVNNAGFGQTGPFVTGPRERYEEMIVLHNLSLMKLTSLLLPAMKRRQRGGILNVASITAFHGIPYNAVYAATKAFILSFSESLREELLGTGVHVTASCPGMTRTALFEKAGMNPDNTLLPVGLPEPVAKASIKALEKNRPYVVPGLLNKLIVHGGKFLPRSFMVRLAILLARNETHGTQATQIRQPH